MPNIKKRGETYLIRVSCGYDEMTGKQITKSMTWKPEPQMTSKQIEKELDRQAHLFEEQCKNGAIVKAGNMKLSDFCVQYLELKSGKLAPTTLKYYEQIFDKRVIPALGHMKLKDIKPMHVQKFILQLQSDNMIIENKGNKGTTPPKRIRKSEKNEDLEAKTRLSNTSIKRYFVAFQSLMALAYKMELITSNPAKAEKLDLPPLPPAHTEIFTKKEAAEMLACLEKEELKYQVLVQLAIILGARRGELMALKWGSINFENKKLTIKASNYKITGEPIKTKLPKDYKIRTISISDYCIELLTRYKQEQDNEAEKLGDQWHNEDWVFTQWNGLPMNIQTPTHWFPKFLKKYNLPHRKFHSLRHTSATLLLCSGVNIKTVSNRLGHADIETTNIYLDALAEADVEATNTLQNLLITQTENTNFKKAN